MNAIGYGKNEDIKNGTPPNIDILLVEQEVAASDEITALQMAHALNTPHGGSSGAAVGASAAGVVRGRQVCSGQPDLMTSY